MDDKLRKQLGEILKKSDAKELKFTLDFFERVKSIELPAESDRAWLSKQFRIHLQALKLAKGDKQAARLFPFVVFDMGRAYERYYAQKKGYNGEGV